jgi:hypothetical protein
MLQAKEGLSDLPPVNGYSRFLPVLVFPRAGVRTGPG